MKVKILVSYLFLLTSIAAVHAQCNISILNVVNDTMKIPCGAMVDLERDTLGQYAIYQDFNAGSVGLGWQTTSSAMLNNPCGFKNSTYLWFGNAATAPRNLATLPMDLSCGGDICFELKFAIQGQSSPCEGPDLPGEGITLEYTTNGTNWTTIFYFQPNTNGNLNAASPNSGDYTAWATYCYPIPPGAMTATTQIRWMQYASTSSGFDHWGLDSITISTNCGAVDNLWSTGDTTQFTNVGPSLADSSYWVRRIVGVGSSSPDTCFDTVIVSPQAPLVELATDFNPYCIGAEVGIDTTNPQYLDSNVSYIFNWGGSIPVDSSSVSYGQIDSLAYQGFVTYTLQHPQHAVCHATDTLDITIQNNLSWNNYQVNDEKCDRSDGLVFAAVNGATNGNAMSYIINGVAYPMAYLNNVSAGTYYIEAIDQNNGCKIDTTLVVDEINGVVIDSLSVFSPECFREGPVGSVYIAVDSAIGNNVTYQYFLNSALFQTTQDDSLNNLPQGFYTVVAQDQYCKDTSYFNVSSPDTVKFVDSLFTVDICKITPTAQYFGAQGGIPPYNFNYNAPLLVQSDVDTTMEFWVTDNVDCRSDTLSMTFRVPNPIQIDPFAGLACPWDSMLVHAAANGGIGNYEFQWSNGQTDSAITVQVNDGINYWVKVSDGCVYPETMYPVISVHPVTDRPLELDLKLCEDESNEFLLPSGQSQYWTAVNGDTFTTRVTELTFSDTGIQNVWWQFMSNDGCIVNGDTSFTVIPNPIADFTFVDTFRVQYVNSDVLFENMSENYIQSDWYVNNQWAGDPNDLDYYFEEHGRQRIRLEIENELGCWDSAYSELFIYPLGEVYIPTAFSPNGDGLNDEFKAVIPETSGKFFMRIYNRWGEEIFYSNDPTIGWDGNMPDGSLAPKEVYTYRVWVAAPERSNGFREEYIGEVTLLRDASLD